MGTVISNLGLSRIFWIALAIVYFFLGVAAYAILTLPENTFELANPDHVKAAVKLTYVRFAFISVVMVSYPIVLLSSLKYAKFFTIALTAWAIAMYVDDYLVLYRIMEYPERGIVVALLITRPILLVCLLWLSFELTFTNARVR